MVPSMADIWTNFELKYGQKTWTKKEKKKKFEEYFFVSKRNVIWSLEAHQFVLNLY